MPRLHHILIANRGEIAWRILRTARALGYRTTAIYSSADASAPYLREADCAICVGPAAVSASYLNVPEILAAAQRSGADAVHPGYGLLSENAAFAEAVRAAGLQFVGPSAEAIHLLGNKRKARQHVRALGVPCVPGYDGEDQSDARLEREATTIGFPLMVKAAAGGGGRGLRRVASARELPEALARARSEALKAFADDRLILEREISDARHVEVQVFGDRHGQAIHLGERDCSLQRRFQKVIEEAPSPAVNPALRAQLGAAAVTIARSCNYSGAGTVELLLTGSGEFYFLEMNTRLQVEHAVTEQVTGLDLVAWQFRVAEGEPLPLTQAEVKLQGHAIEARLYAEQPAQGFVPATGRILQLELPEQLVRVDHALRAGLEIGPHYDAMLGKLIAHAGTREGARRKLMAALDQLRVLGIATNQRFLRELLDSPAFASGSATTSTLERAERPRAPAPAPQAFAIAALLFLLRDQQQGAYAPELRGFSNARGLERYVLLEHERERSQARLAAESCGWIATIGAVQTSLSVVADEGAVLEVNCDGVRQRVHYTFADPATLYLHAAGLSFSVRDATYAPKQAASAAGSGRALAPMDGNLLAVSVRVGEAVTAGQTLAVVEAMKLELRVVADRAGTVASLHAERGSQVKAGQLLIELS